MTNQIIENDFDLGDDAEDSANSPLRFGFKRRKVCPFCHEGAVKIDYKDMRFLSRFVSERGKIIPSRITGVCAKHQRELRQAIQRARFLALLPYENK